jgi:hypothetical protein
MRGHREGEQRGAKGVTERTRRGGKGGTHRHGASTAALLQRTHGRGERRATRPQRAHHGSTRAQKRVAQRLRLSSLGAFPVAFSGFRVPANSRGVSIYGWSCQGIFFTCSAATFTRAARAAAAGPPCEKKDGTRDLKEA